MLSQRFLLIVAPFCSTLIFSFVLFLSFVATPLAARTAPPEGDRLSGADPVTSQARHNSDSLLGVYTLRANQVLDLYVKAQQSLYTQDHDKAMGYIDRALALNTNAELLAFKGALYFGMGRMAEARDSFMEAFHLDRNAAVPFVEGLQQWLRENRLPR